jgi:FHA domain-containing protein
MDLLGKARSLESRIAGTLDRAAKDLVRSGPREPLEIVHAILDAVDREVQPAGRGRRVFPFNRIELSVAAPSRETRGRLEAVLAGDPPLRGRILERLRTAGCAVADVVVAIDYADHADDSWRTPDFDLRFARVDETQRQKLAHDVRPPRVEAAVLRGVAERRSYSLVVGARIDIGRGSEVRDSGHRLIRTNHVAFTEGSDEANQTVSRQHAHIACDPRTGHLRLHDDGSGHGTGIVRDGRTVPVPRGSRGVRLRSGDEIVLGAARLRIRFSADEK